MAERKQVNVRVPGHVKSQWDEAIDDDSLPEYNSLSDLVRLSVQRELVGEHQGFEDRFTSGGSNDEQLNELLDTSRETNRLLNELSRDVQTVRREVTTDDELTDLMGEVYQLLPEGPESEKDVIGEVDDLANPTSAELSRAYGKVGDMADALDTTEQRVEQAISQLKEDMPGMIRSAGEGRYYREV
jgi:Arc/MetJ-type ribon-helix-helix transcriptional regulator